MMLIKGMTIWMQASREGSSLQAMAMHLLYTAVAAQQALSCRSPPRLMLRHVSGAPLAHVSLQEDRLDCQMSFFWISQATMDALIEV